LCILFTCLYCAEALFLIAVAAGVGVLNVTDVVQIIKSWKFWLHGFVSFLEAVVEGFG
jgi:hypothetical protein